jgi:hypothetical protein
VVGGRRVRRGRARGRGNFEFEFKGVVVCTGVYFWDHVRSIRKPERNQRRKRVMKERGTL